jgi:hypothetical protein
VLAVEAVVPVLRAAALLAQVELVVAVTVKAMVEP